MIHDAAHLPLPARLRADLCVVGSGAGGSAVAMVAAEAGLRVLVLEPGDFLTPADMTQREEEMLERLLWESGGRTTADRAVHVHQGRGVGGSTLHNLNLCKRIPAPIRDAWQADHRVERLTPAVWDALYAEVEALLHVSAVPEARWNRHNRLLQAGCEALGWRGAGLHHNRVGCVGSGFCEVGCAYDAKMNAARVLIPRAVKAGAEVLVHAQAVRLHHDAGRVRQLEAVALDPTTREVLGRLEITAERFVLSASATGTPALLLRSAAPDASGLTGNTLRLHPALVAAGDFAEPVRAWEGIPQTYECTELLDFTPGADRRVWIVPAFAHPMGFATLLPGHGAAHRDLMLRYPHLAVFTAMLHDHTAGRVRPSGDLGLTVDYWPDPSDRAQLTRGLAACARLLQAAGATRVLVPTDPAIALGPSDDPDRLSSLPLRRGDQPVTAVHPMGSVPMSDDPALGPVRSDGRHHQLSNLWVADGSLFPTSIGVPPQLSIYALGLHVGRAAAGLA